MKLSRGVTAIVFITCSMVRPVVAGDGGVPELLNFLEDSEVIHLTPEEAAETRGESMKKEVPQYGHCGLRRCTKMFVNDKHVYTVYEDGSVYFVKQ